MVMLSTVDGPPRTKCGSHAWCRGSSIAAALGPGGLIVGDYRLCDRLHANPHALFL